VYILT